MKPIWPRIRTLLFLLTLLLVASPVHPAVQDVAPAEAKDYFSYMELEGLGIFLSNLPCSNEVADAGGLKPDPAIRARYKALRVIANNQFFKGCYRADGTEAYLIFLETGERTAVPQELFQPIEKPTH